MNLARRSQTDTVQALYRGLSGPTMLFQLEQFLPYAHGNSCERGLLSTTKDLATAIVFSGARKHKEFPIVCEIDAGAFDFGADVASFSQYPGGALASASFC